MPNFGYHLARLEGKLVRRLYCAFMPAILARSIAPGASIPFDVFSYSGHAALPEQIMSIRSFLKCAGRPRQFTVVSDGSHSSADIAMLKRIDSCVSVTPLPEVPPNLPSELSSYLKRHPTGKQLALIMSLPRNGPALYLDSDILFFARAGDLSTLAEARNISAFYLADCQFSGDARLIRSPNEREHPVNTGVIFLFKKLDWSLGIGRFAQLNGAPHFFTNQTMTHLTMHANGASPLDRAKYVLQLDDQTVYADRYASDTLVLRHYVNPVRHKFWTTLWRQ
jgi:hypothetical protein